MSLKKNLDVLVFDRMRDRIINGDWLPGQNLDIDELAEYYEVSRTPIIQALKQMQTQEMVIVSRNGKYSIPRFDKKHVRDICTIRLLLEQQAVTEIKDKKIVIHADLLHTIGQKCYRANMVGDVTESRREDLTWHKTLVKEAGNDCLNGIYEKVQGQFMVANFLQIFHTKEQQLVASDEHLKIVEALSNQSYDMAFSLLGEHINLACEKILHRMDLSQL